ncbi:hypothetical protein KC851_02075 [Candidatus Kaiserbacteria bacterium]|nr:hypothetical protein [Candidatus Kaiserbacteria bacterium]
MRVTSHRKFDKQYSKLPKKIKNKFKERASLLIENPDSPLLKVHILSGKKYPLKSMNVTADYRALFIDNGKVITFFEIGSHSELYE